MAQYTEIHTHDSTASDEVVGMSMGMIVLIIAVIAFIGLGLYWWQPWAPPTSHDTTVIQQQPSNPAPDTTIVNPPSNTTIVNPPSSPPSTDIKINNGGGTGSTGSTGSTGN